MGIDGFESSQIIGKVNTDFGWREAHGFCMWGGTRGPLLSSLTAARSLVIGVADALLCPVARQGNPLATLGTRAARPWLAGAPVLWTSM